MTCYEVNLTVNKITNFPLIGRYRERFAHSPDLLALGYPAQALSSLPSPGLY